MLLKSFSLFFHSQLIVSSCINDMDMISLLIVLAAALVGWGIGANSASNAISPLVGLNIISFRVAALIVSVLMLI